MNNKYIFAANDLVSSDKLPLTFISLEEWNITFINGIDAKKYLQSQIPCNVNKIKNNEYYISAYCNTYGKTISIFYIFPFFTGFALLGRKSTQELQLNTLKKYSIFSKVTINLNNKYILFGIVGSNARKWLKNFFDVLPSCTNKIVYNNDCILLHFLLPNERFILFTNNENILYKLLYNKNNIYYNNSLQWTTLDIESGYPILNISMTNKFFPQEININKFHGIDFNKGCYLGQEMIARIQHYNLNKKLLVWLISKNIYNKNINITKIGNNILEVELYNQCWKPAGQILSSCLVQKYIWIQAVLNNKFCIKNKIFRYNEFGKYIVFYIHNIN